MFKCGCILRFSIIDNWKDWSVSDLICDHFFFFQSALNTLFVILDMPAGLAMDLWGFSLTEAWVGERSQAGGCYGIIWEEAQSYLQDKA